MRILAEPRMGFDRAFDVVLDPRQGGVDNDVVDVFEIEAPQQRHHVFAEAGEVEPLGRRVEQPGQLFAPQALAKRESSNAVAVERERERFVEVLFDEDSPLRRARRRSGVP